MFETIATGLFVLVVLSIWSNSDVKSGQVHNIALLLPVFFAIAWSPVYFISAFVPVFVVLAGLHMAVRKKGLFGFADVVALPFVMMFLLGLNIFGVMVFMGVFAYLVMVTCRERFDKKLKRKIYSRILLMPVLLLSYFAGFVVHLIFALIF